VERIAAYSIREGKTIVTLWHPQAQRHESPNFDPGLVNPSLIVLHWTATVEVKKAINWLCDSRSEASAHFIVDTDGRLHQLVPLNSIAWHAGKSEFAGRQHCNHFSIGIEIVNAGEVYAGPGAIFKSWSGEAIPPFSVVSRGDKWFDRYEPAQIQAVQYLLLWLKSELPSLKHVAGHSEVSPGRKIDPGPCFNLDATRAWWEGRR
jgi:N-acetylmuramoyl-L-alanine amidase